MLPSAKGTYPRLSLVWADSAYGGGLVDWAASCCGFRLPIVKKSDEQKKAEDQKDVKGLAVQPQIWIVECPFARLCRYRRLVRDYEFLPQSNEAMIRLVMCHLMIRRLKTT